MQEAFKGVDYACAVERCKNKLSSAVPIIGFCVVVGLCIISVFLISTKGAI
jgi:hypothetical protein